MGKDAPSVESLAVAVADAAVELCCAIAARTKAKQARRTAILRYADAHDEDATWYPIYVGQYEEPLLDAACEAAIAELAKAQAEVREARGKWRRATTKYLRNRSAP